MNLAEVSKCQHCEQGVSWSRCPEDAGYAAFTHDGTNRVACAGSEAPVLGDQVVRSAKVSTAELVVGDVLLIDGRLVRTVAEVVESGWLNRDDLPIYSVRYAEGEEPGVWSGANTGIASTLWVRA